MSQYFFNVFFLTYLKKKNNLLLYKHLGEVLGFGPKVVLLSC